MPVKKYELKISSPSPIIEFDEWYGEKNASVKGNPPRKYKAKAKGCLLYTSPSPRDRTRSRMPSSA